jgi:hypothetical protein
MRPDRNHMRADAGNRRDALSPGFCFGNEPLHLGEVLRDGFHGPAPIPAR